MKKAIFLIIAIILSTILVACSNSSEDNPLNREQSTEETKINITKVEKSIDAIAGYLGYSDGEETYYTTIGAVAGKEFDGGRFELYQFDEESEAYNNMISGNSYLNVAAYKDGFILVFPMDVQTDNALVEKFNSIYFL